MTFVIYDIKVTRKKGKLLEHTPGVLHSNCYSVYSVLKHQQKRARIDFKRLILLAFGSFQNFEQFKYYQYEQAFLKDEVQDT